MYLILVFWFWRTPIAMIAKQLVQPFGELVYFAGLTKGISVSKTECGVFLSQGGCYLGEQEVT